MSVAIKIATAAVRISSVLIEKRIPPLLFAVNDALKRDNGSDHRAGTAILQAEKPARKPGLWSLRIVICCQRREPERSSESAGNSLNMIRPKIKIRK